MMLPKSFALRNRGSPPKQTPTSTVFVKAAGVDDDDGIPSAVVDSSARHGGEKKCCLRTRLAKTKSATGIGGIGPTLGPSTRLIALLAIGASVALLEYRCRGGICVFEDHLRPQRRRQHSLELKLGKGRGYPLRVYHLDERDGRGTTIAFERRKFQQLDLVDDANGTVASGGSDDEGEDGDGGVDSDCEPMRWWQETSFPSCNRVHEAIDLTDVSSSGDGGGGGPKFVHIAHGVFNDVFKVADVDVDGGTYILKRLKSKKDYSKENMDRVCRDAIVMERLTKSPNIMDVYSYCGFTTLVPFGEGGNLSQYHREIRAKAKADGQSGIPRPPRFALAAHIAEALADLHGIGGDDDDDDDGRGSAVSHGDLTSVQFVMVDGKFRLADFNQGQFIRWNEKRGEPCPYTTSRADSKYRSPEEYRHGPIGAKTDVWSLGIMIQRIATGRSVWKGVDSPEARRRIVKGEFPPVSDEFKNSRDPIDVVLRTAIGMCLVYDPGERSTAGEVARFLTGEAERVGVTVTGRPPV